MSDFWKMLTAMSALFVGLATLIVSLHLATSARIDRLQAEHSAIRTEVRDLGRELYELRGELKGRDLLGGLLAPRPDPTRPATNPTMMSTRGMRIRRLPK